MIAQGASRVQTGQTDVDAFVVDPACPDPFETTAWKEWIERVKKIGFPLNGAMLASAHQMGTCRMTSNPRTGVCKPTGETWEVKGLWVADASLFPTASGVNPMLTTYSMAKIVSNEIVTSLSQSRI